MECRISQQWLSCNDSSDSVFTSNLNPLSDESSFNECITAPVEESNNTSAQVYWKKTLSFSSTIIQVSLESVSFVMLQMDVHVHTFFSALMFSE